jgi:hypothetical protein
LCFVALVVCACGFCRCDALAISLSFLFLSHGHQVPSAPLLFISFSALRVRNALIELASVFVFACLFFCCGSVGVCSRSGDTIAFTSFAHFCSTKKKCFVCHLDIAFCSGNIELFTGQC